MSKQGKRDFRPNIHFTPEKNWNNDPNGLIYIDGIWHLYYQHNPNDVVWGPMHWGHAVSKDLIHWEHLPVALYPDEIGTMYSGSMAYDENNTSGFAKYGEKPMVAVYTAHNMETGLEQQCIAYSLDQGKHFEKYYGNPVIENAGTEFDAFVGALQQIAVYMARMIAGDGEGATKLLVCHVASAPCKSAAKTIAKSVITSSLFKTAMFGADANWGRILCAIGYADAEFSVSTVDVSLVSKAGKIDVCKNGFGVPFSEEEAKKILSEKEILIDIVLNQGPGEATAWGCDLTYDYVKINGDYRT